jgi:fused signal recognition particle receptor
VELLEVLTRNPELLVYTAPLWPLLVVGLTRLFGGREVRPAARPELPAPAPVVDVAVAVAAPAGPVVEREVEPRVVLPSARAEEAGTVEPAARAPVVPLEPEPAPVEIPAARPLGERLRRTSEALAGRLGALLGTRKVDEDLLGELEALLFTADLGVKTAESLLDTVRRKASGKDAAEVRGVLRDAIAERLARVEPSAPAPGLAAGPMPHSPHVILVLGVNGAGKTTTIGKLAARYRAAGRSVVLGAADTFRAAAIEQLQAWGERSGCEVVASQAGGDPAAVAFDAVKAATARGADVAIIDTAGRLQTKGPLMEELGKIARVIGRDLEGAPHETLLVLDANTGQNALSQAKLFTEVAGVTGIALTKLDGTAKGGVIVGLADEFGIPVRYVGVGEGVEDLRDFSAADFVAALFPDA